MVESVGGGNFCNRAKIAQRFAYFQVKIARNFDVFAH